LYGNTVNTAARMAQNASPGTILASSHFASKLDSILKSPL
jgi:class 3 adenylate cyclase